MGRSLLFGRDCSLILSRHPVDPNMTVEIFFRIAACLEALVSNNLPLFQRFWQLKLY